MHTRCQEERKTSREEMNEVVCCWEEAMSMAGGRSDASGRTLLQWKWTTERCAPHVYLYSQPTLRVWCFWVKTDPSN